MELRKKSKLSARAAVARGTAKLFGGRALTGTPKQREWGEKIRASKIKGERGGPFEPQNTMTDEQVLLACSPTGVGRSAHFWIENRDRKPSEIGQFFEQQKALLAAAAAAREAGDAEQYAVIAAEYNALTAEWGLGE